MTCANLQVRSVSSVYVAWRCGGQRGGRADMMQETAACVRHTTEVMNLVASS